MRVRKELGERIGIHNAPLLLYHLSTPTLSQTSIIYTRPGTNSNQLRMATTPDMSTPTKAEANATPAQTATPIQTLAKGFHLLRTPSVFLSTMYPRGWPPPG